MAKTTHCPFTHSLCAECALYRGRHRYLSLSKQDGADCTNKIKEHDSVDSKALKNFVEPWASKSIQAKSEPMIRLKVIDMESGETRIYESNEAKTWDWSNPVIIRIIDGRQVTSLNNLIEILFYKAEKGYQEVEVYEVRRFMLLVGG
jgi:hypothetical protein